MRFLSLALISLAAVCFAQPVTSASSGLSPKQLAQIRHSGLRLVVPTYVPAGFRVTELKLDKDGSCNIIYKKKGGAEFWVEMASEGIGDILFNENLGKGKEVEGSREISNKISPKLTMNTYQRGTAKQFHIDWVDLGEGAKPRFYLVFGERMDYSTGQKIIESLRFADGK